MKLATLKSGHAVLIASTERPGVLEATPLTGMVGPRWIEELLLDPPTDLAEWVESVRDPAGTAHVELDDLAPPMTRPGKIVAVGLNYLDHITETSAETPEHPLVFAKFTSSITGPADPIELPATLTDQVDFEVELGVVIGRRATRVPKDLALEHVFGYTVINDVSARDLQFADGQWVRAKSLDTFCPMGPWIVTADEIPDPTDLRVRCMVNGETLQDATTGDMIHGVAELVSVLSHSFTLEPGDVIATGTPSGVGFTREPAVFLRDGDVVECVIDGVGAIRNHVRAAKQSAERLPA